MSVRLSRIHTSAAGESLLKDLSLELEAGALNVVLGPTGAGKTELLRVIAGLDRVDSGTLEVDGVDVTNLDVRKRNVAFVYQEFINYPNLTVFENIASPLRVRGVGADEIQSRVREVAGLLGISQLLERLPGEISGGQQQRVALGRALVREAECILLDEPLVNLDFKLRERLRRDIRELFADSPAVVVFATADPTEAQLLGGNLCVLDGGRLLQSGPAAEQYRRPANLRSAGILSDPPLNLIEARAEDGAIDMTGSRISFARARILSDDANSQAADWNGELLIGIRPHHIHVTPPGSRVLPGRVQLAELSGSETFLHVETADGTLIVQREGTHHFDLGQEIELYLETEDVFLFHTAANGGNLLHAPADQIGLGESQEREMHEQESRQGESGP